MDKQETKKGASEKILKAMSLMDDVWWVMESAKDIKAQNRAETIRRKMYELLMVLDDED